MAGRRTAAVTAAPCPTSVTARPGVRQHTEGVTPPAIHSCGRTGGETTAGPPDAAQLRAGHHSAPDPSCVPLAHPPLRPAEESGAEDGVQVRIGESAVRVQAVADATE